MESAYLGSDGNHLDLPQDNIAVKATMLQVFANLFAVCVGGVPKTWIYQRPDLINTKNLQMQPFWKGRV